MPGIGAVQEVSDNPVLNRRGRRYKLGTNIVRLKELLARELEPGQQERISAQLTKAERNLAALGPTEGL